MRSGWGSSVRDTQLEYLSMTDLCKMVDVGRTYLSLPTGHCHVHESSGVCDSLLRSALWGLLLLLGLNLYRDKDIESARRSQMIIPS